MIETWNLDPGLSESWDQNPGAGGKSAWLILWRKQKAELEKITSIREEHWDILGHLRTRRLGTDIYKPLVIDQVIVLRRDYKGSVGAGLSLCRTGDNAPGHNGHTRTEGADTATLETWSLGP